MARCGPPHSLGANELGPGQLEVHSGATLAINVCPGPDNINYWYTISSLVGNAGAWDSGSTLAFDTTSGVTSASFGDNFTNPGMNLAKVGADDGTNSLTLSGNIATGSGSVAVKAGTLYLTGANTYTGGTTISGGGILLTSNPDALSGYYFARQRRSRQRRRGRRAARR